MAARSMQWSEVAARLAPSRNYWLNSLASDGSPHVAPVWGAVVDDVLFIYSERSTVKAKNVANDSRVVVHLESGDNVVIVHATAEDVGRPDASPAVMAALDAKYQGPRDAGYLPSSDEDFDVLFAIRPSRALLWKLSDYDGSQRRWAAG